MLDSEPTSQRLYRAPPPKKKKSTRCVVVLGLKVFWREEFSLILLWISQVFSVFAAGPWEGLNPQRPGRCTRRMRDMSSIRH